MYITHLFEDANLHDAILKLPTNHDVSHSTTRTARVLTLNHPVLKAKKSSANTAANFFFASDREKPVEYHCVNRQIQKIRPDELFAFLC